MTDRLRPFAIEPRRERPDGPPPSYGVPPEGGVFIEWPTVTERLATAEAYWLGTVTPDGRPHVVPVWGILFENDFFLETGSPATRKNRNLAANRNVVVHLDGINDALIVRGTAERVPSDQAFRGRLAAAMKQKYGGNYPDYEPEPDRWDQGSAWRINPESVLAWREMPTATRWRFDLPAPI
jgi:nitroimidazol reductase NimA-like FMN-containing flavoprotein (pyridoxamine 5'-phosphate oxidase superfamily)